MKKDYITPTIEVVELDTEQALMNILVGSITWAGTGSGSAGDKDPELAPEHRRRGEWGDLWK